MSSTTQPDLASAPLDPEKLRADFPILGQLVHGRFPLVYLDNAASTQRPRQVIQAIVDLYEQHYANVHRGIHWLSDHSTDLFEQAREKVRAFINAADTAEIIFTRGTTESINLVARSWGDANLKAGDEILLSEMEHHANLVPWQQTAERNGAICGTFPSATTGNCNSTSSTICSASAPASWPSPRCRTCWARSTPSREIIRRAHAAGALVLVDAAQSVPHQAVDVQALGADFLAFSGHKMLGPSGVGVLYGRRELLEAMPPFLGGGSMIRRVRLDGFEPADLPAKFEAGTPPIAPAIGLGTAIDYLSAIGLSRIHAHEQRLCRLAHKCLEQAGGVRFLGPGCEHKAGIVSFTCAVHPHDVAQLLDQQGIAVRAGHHCTMPLHKRLGINASTRASFYFYNTEAEVAQLGTALAESQQRMRRKSTPT